MKKDVIKRLIVFVLCAIFLFVFSEDRMQVKASEDITVKSEINKANKAIWFWCDYNSDYEMNYVYDDYLRKETLDKLQYDGINMIFLTMDTDNLSIYKDFIKDAHERGIKVQALFGDSAMIYEDSNQWTHIVIDNIYEYNNKVDDIHKIDGIHYDVEFYYNINRDNTEDDWIDGESKESRKSLVRKKYINFVREVCSYAYSKKIKTAFSVPSWLDRYTFYDDDGFNKNIADEVCRASDYIVIMDYTTNTDNIYSSLDNTEVHTFSDGSRTKADMTWLERVSKFNNQLIIDVDLNTLKNDSNKCYEYSKDYVMKIINDSMSKIESNVEKEELSLNYGYAIQDVYSWLKLRK